MQRPLWQTMTDLVSGALVCRESEQTRSVRVTSISLDVPLEIAFGATDILADVPAWRWRTDFDLPLGRLKLRLGEQEDDA